MFDRDLNTVELLNMPGIEKVLNMCEYTLE